DEGDADAGAVYAAHAAPRPGWRAPPARRSRRRRWRWRRQEARPLMLAPKKVKHRKVHRGSMAGVAKGNTEIHFGEFALKAMDRCWLTSNQIEAARIAMTRHVKRGGKIWIRVFPD